LPPADSVSSSEFLAIFSSKTSLATWKSCCFGVVEKFQEVAGKFQDIASIFTGPRKIFEASAEHSSGSREDLRDFRAVLAEHLTCSGFLQEFT
jgi:hypothetical protein